MGLAALKIEDLPHYTYDDYAQWEGRWEVINGIPYAMTPAPAMKHQRLSMKIAFQLDNLLENCGNCRTYQAIDWQITEDTVVQPDVLVVCGEYTEREKLLIPPVMVVEILSPSTSRKDKIIKYQLYENAGVKYYCLVDPETNSAVVFELNIKKFREMKMTPFKDDNVTFDFDTCIIAFDFGKVF
jgi:Uma2 family endonuclease